MRACVLKEVNSPLVIEERPSPEPKPDDVVVALKAAALNRRDYWITQGKYPRIQLPAVPGSDGAGIVTRCGANVDRSWLRQRVVINPGLNWGPHQAAQSESFSILGMPLDGTFAEEVCVPVTQVFPCPPHLSWHQAAAMPLAGVTAFRALFYHAELSADDRVLITGAGGGVASMALLYAVAAKAQVWVTSSSANKIQKAVQLGAVRGFDYRATDWVSEFRHSAGSATIVIDGAGGSGCNDLIQLAAPGGRIVCYGATAGAPPKTDLFRVFWKQLRLQGSTMGSPQDFEHMLGFVRDQQIEPVIDSVWAMEAINDALARLQDDSHFGKIVVTIDDD